MVHLIIHYLTTPYFNLVNNYKQMIVHASMKQFYLKCLIKYMTSKSIIQVISEDEAVSKQRNAE